MLADAISYREELEEQAGARGLCAEGGVAYTVHRESLPDIYFCTNRHWRNTKAIVSLSTASQLV